MVKNKKGNTIQNDDKNYIPSLLVNIATSHTLLENEQIKQTQYIDFIKEKLQYLQEVIQNTIFSIEHYKKNDLFSNIAVLKCFQELSLLQEETEIMLKVDYLSGLNTFDKMNDAIKKVQECFNTLSIIFSKYGTKDMETVLYIIFGKQCILQQKTILKTAKMMSKLNIILKYVHPTGYAKVTNIQAEDVSVNVDILCTDKIDNVTNTGSANHLECFEPDTIDETMYRSIHEIRTVVRNHGHSVGTIVVHGWLANIPALSIKNEEYLDHRISDLNGGFLEHFSEKIDDTSEKEYYDESMFQRFLNILTIKDLLVYSKTDIYKKYAKMVFHVKMVKRTNMKEFIKYFFDMNTLLRREMLIHLLLYNKDNEIQYIAYMLYDLMGTNNQGETIDTHEQKELYHTFPWYCKQYFKETLTNTYEHAQDIIYKPDTNKITLEQQVLLLRSNEKIKQKALVKLKEVKEKSDEGGGKAKQYLEGLVRIPFGLYYKEPLLTMMSSMNHQFLDMLTKTIDPLTMGPIQRKTKYTVQEMLHYMHQYKKILFPQIEQEFYRTIPHLSKKQLTKVMSVFDTTLDNTVNILHSRSSKNTKSTIIEYIQAKLNFDCENAVKIERMTKILDIVVPNYPQKSLYNLVSKQTVEIARCNKMMASISDVLDKSIYGHQHAKSQLLKIIGQWINGEQSGYCFGFEGAPGLGKTSLAKKGLAKCLQDEKGVSRPFSFVAMGGSCNGSTLEGHNYTYLNSTWGKVMDILMESGCMNPIIYIDELDKISKTEQGREIVGILMHLIDQSQNDEFHDKYFNIPVDLSKALFIFSYNDPEQIDRVLLDRIHRIKFEPLSNKEKRVIVKQYIIPELDQKMGFCGTVELSDEVIDHIIEFYTLEPGVRKLKEILFDLYGEINLQLLQSCNALDIRTIYFPMQIAIDDLGDRYLTHYTKMHKNQIHSSPSIGRINGLWANHLGRGGIIPIETVFFPTSTFLELKLTGLQGDVMKESMNVAKSLAWKLTSQKQQTELVKTFDETRVQGIHIHCPEGAVSKDGPSAGAAITLAIYSLLNNIPISHSIAITGEVNLQGEIMAIGGLEYKIIGAIHAGVKTILFPEANTTDFDAFMKKTQDIDVSGIHFMKVGSIKEVFAIVFPIS